MELALLRARLDAFQQRFYDKAGAMYLAFDEARTESARLRSRFQPAAHREHLAAHEQWKLSAADCQRALAKPAAAAPAMRRLHVDLARKFHPDLALDRVRRSLAEQLMAEVNIAFQDGDLRRLEAMERAVQGSVDAAREMAELTRSVPFQLNARNQYALRQQQDLLTDLTAWLYAQVGHARLAAPAAPARLHTNLMQRALEDLQHVSIRLLRFPQDSALGQLQVRAERDIDSPFTVLGEAKGAVRVPFAKATILRIRKHCDSLEALRALDPEDINGLIDEWPDFVPLTDEMLRPLAVFSRLEELHLARTPITGRAFDSFPPLHELRVLILDETAFDDHGMERLAECIWMQRLDLSSTRITGRGLAALHRLKSLRDLSLYSTGITDSDLTILDDLPALRNLNLGLTQVTDAAIDRISSLRHLEVLHLGGVAITDATASRLAAMPMLRDLVLWETQLTGAGLRCLESCASLRYLDVDQTGVTAEDLRLFRPARPDIRMPSDIWAETPA
jgi:hypothetical protein